MKKWLFILGVLIVGSILFSGVTRLVTSLSRQKVDYLVHDIHNSDVKWSVNIFGLTVRLGGASKLVAEIPGKRVDFMLLDLLRDKSRFVAAHVILSKRFELDHLVNIQQFNGLQVETVRENFAMISSNQMPSLYEEWKKRIGDAGVK